MKASSIVVASENVQIKRIRRRRSLLLNVTREGVIVKAPYYVSNQDIHQFVTEHLSWIKTQKQKLPPKVSFTHGEELYFLGYPRMLNIHLARPGVMLTDNDIFLYHPNPTPQSTKKQLKAFYQTEAQKYLPKRVARFESIMALTSQGLQIKTYKSRWGSCDAKGQIQLNWHLMMVPRDTIDYVIIHELSHLVHFNHSPAFWAHVRSFVPDYVAHKKWLRAHSQLLSSVFESS